MGKISSRKRRTRLKIADSRKKKLAWFRRLYLSAKFESDKKAILDKVFKIAPWISKEDFVKSSKK
jgi:hypothetical protein